MGILIALLFALICAMIAASKGRNVIGWFLIGFFFSLIGLILILVVSNVKEREEREQRLRTENRRLRERVKKDRQIADQRHAETGARLSVHDRALGLDTAARLDAAATPGQLTPPPPPGPSNGHVESLQWFFVGEEGREGPLEFAALRDRFDRGQLQLDTLVWCKEQTDWIPLRERPDLQEALIA